jgi:NADPH:quinone reductase-like Zn-dependent oxidoreductase
MRTMTALRAHYRGGPEVLVVEQVPVPVAAAGEVLVAVHAAAITFDELTWPETWEHDGADRTPIIPSHEVSGVVEAVGEGVTDVAVGAQVYALIDFDRDGAAADYATVPAVHLAARPTTVSHVVAAALPMTGLTAWQALVGQAKVQPGERVLVTGGAGGVGALVVQLAHLRGAEVTATVRSDATELAVGYGAKHVIDVRSQPIPRQEYDAVIDTVGGAALDGAFAAVKRGGRLITLSAPLPPGSADEYGVAATFFIVTPDRAQLIELAELVDAGRLQVPVTEVFPLTQGRAAFESGRVPGRRPGKTVLSVRD